jgi:2-phosphosulfolactate phosphatase
MVAAMPDDAKHVPDPPAGRRPHRVRFEWGVEGLRSMMEPGELAIVIDVFVFSTTVSVAVEKGAAAVPVARVVGDPGGTPRDGVFPTALLDVAAGTEVALPSRNGATCTAVAAGAGAIVLAGSLRNATAVGRYAAASGRSVSVVAAGERWSDGTLRVAFEDLVAAGAVLSAFGTGDLSPEAQAAVGAFDAVRDDLPARLLACRSGRMMVDHGHARDVELAAQLDVTDLVPVFDGRRFRAARARS